jgi:6-pyruvoyltetrahydropterin/6-carboxytetrahydropterin synthase
VEIKLSSNFLDNGQMVYDFGLMKGTIKDFIDSFDHAITLWEGDSLEYREFAKKFSERWIELPVNPSAEQFSRLFFLGIDKILSQTQFQNGEREVKLHSVIVHETDTGYAECFREDAYNFQGMGELPLERVKFSPQIRREWKNPDWWEQLLRGEPFINPRLV